MDASIVYQVAKALCKEEQIKLYDMLEKDIVKSKGLKPQKKLPSYSLDDAIKYLIKNHF